MISQYELESVIGRDYKPGHHVLSVYLDVNQSQAVHHAHGFEPVLRGLLRPIEARLSDESEQKAFAASAGRMLRFVADYTAGAPSLVMFCDQADDFFWQREFRVPLRNAAHWNDTPYGRSLTEVLNEHERYGVILADRAKARLFTMYLNECEEYPATLASEQVRRYRKVGTDQMRSQAGAQRRAEQHSRWHLKETAERMDRLAATAGFDRLLLAGPVETTTELQRLLPHRLQSRLVPSIALPVEANQKQLLDALLDIEQNVEREAEAHLVRELTITATKNPQAAVVGDEATLKALQAGRVWKLVYADDFSTRGGQCKQCSALFADLRLTCGYCDGEVQELENLTDRFLERVNALDGTVKIVHGDAAVWLRRQGGIGAFLRF